MAHGIRHAAESPVGVQKMKTLIVEDDFTCRLLLQEILQAYGPVHIAVDGDEAEQSVRAAWESGSPYDLICMDIMMPKTSGQEAVKLIRQLEKDAGVDFSDAAKIVMTTSLGDMKNLMQAFQNLADGYLVKPIHADDLLDELRKLELID
jgi:two-component system, chemotaxis family, chemotaxis protein CheY